MVMTARSIDWWHGVSAAVALNNQIVVAAPAVDSAWSGILTAHRTTTGWISRRIPIRAGLPPVGVALAGTVPRPLLFYHDVVSPDGGKAVYLRELALDSGEWGAERLIDSLRNGGLNWPLAVQSPDKTVHVVFAFTGDNRGTESLVHLSSADVVSWQVNRLPLNVRARGLAVAADAESSVQIVMQTPLFDGLASTRATRAGFAPIEQLSFAAAIGSSPNLVPVGSDTLIMTWTVHATSVFNNEAVFFPVTLVSRRTRTCR